jgi:hypothetical protein
VEADDLAHIDARRSGAPRLVFAVGAASRGEAAARATAALADRFGTPPVTFPGDHGGFMAEPAAFADAIRQVPADR